MTPPTPKAKDKEEKPEQAPTEYVVLERRPLYALPTADTWTEHEADGSDGPSLEAWLVVGETDTKKAGGMSEKTVIEGVVGQREGTFKAVAKRAWKGGVKLSRVESMKAEPLD